MIELLLGIVGGLVVALVAWFASLTKRKSPPLRKALDNATSKHELVVQEVEAILVEDSPEENLADLINKKHS
tara:strand:+ start:25 stop:240 length:216 start_codon:yes stop_codon:yes gene_type:complete